MTTNHEILERRLKALLDSLGATLSASERIEVEVFIQAGEYGIALETLCSILIEESKGIPERHLTEIRALGMSMELDPDTWAGVASSS